MPGHTLPFQAVPTQGANPGTQLARSEMESRPLVETQSKDIVVEKVVVGGKLGTAILQTGSPFGIQSMSEDDSLKALKVVCLGWGAQLRAHCQPKATSGTDPRSETPKRGPDPGGHRIAARAAEQAPGRSWYPKRRAARRARKATCVPNTLEETKEEKETNEKNEAAEQEEQGNKQEGKTGWQENSRGKYSKEATKFPTTPDQCNHSPGIHSQLVRAPEPPNKDPISMITQALAEHRAGGMFSDKGSKKIRRDSQPEGDITRSKLSEEGENMVGKQHHEHERQNGMQGGGSEHNTPRSSSSCGYGAVGPTARSHVTQTLFQIGSNGSSGTWQTTNRPDFQLTLAPTSHTTCTKPTQTAKHARGTGQTCIPKTAILHFA